MNKTVVDFFTQFSFFSALQESIGTSLTVLLLFLLASLVLLVAVLTIGGLGTYAERKISADIQARIGPNRVGPFGLLQFIADAVKLIAKEDIVPNTANPLLFFLAPLLCVLGVFATLTVLPVSSGFALSQLNVGVFYLIAVSSVVGLGVFLGGYASNSKWSMLGGMRGASQIISYEIPVTISILSIVLVAGGMSFGDIVGSQAGLPHQWFILHNPFTFIAFFVFFIGALAEANRAPFDLPEAESELVSGFHTEYSGMRFAFFGLAEFAEVFVLCAVCASLFLGGYQVPFGLGGEGIVGQLLQVGTFFGKAFTLYYVVIWIRWTLPRLRADQLMAVCWKYLTPIALFNLVGTALWVYLFKGASLYQVIFKGGAL